MSSNLIIWARRPWADFLFVLILLFFAAATLRAANYGAVSASGTWSTSSSWTPTGVPGASDTVYIGSNTPSGAAATATVTLTQNQSASNLYLGYASGDSGTLNLGNFNLAVGSSVYIGNSVSSTGSITRGSGSLTAQSVYLNYQNAFTFGAGDVASYLSLSNSSALTTTGTGNVTGNASIYSGSKLTLGADMTLSGNFDLEDSGSTLDMGGHKLSANYIYLGWNDGVAVNVANVGPLNATNYLYVYGTAINPPALNAGNLYVEYGSTLNLPTSGTASSLTLAYSSALTTVSTGNVTGTVSVYNGSKLTLGADMLLSGQFNLYSTGSTLDMGGDKLSASSIYLGWSGGVPTLANRGPLLASNLYVANQPFSLSPSDSAANLYLSNVGLGSLGGHSVSTLSLSNTSALTTTLTGSVTGNASIYSGSKLTLGADMTLSGNFDLEDSGSTLDMGGHKLSANYIYLGWNDSVAVNVANVGPLNATNYLYVYGTAINPPALNAGNLYVEYGSTLNLPTSGTASSLTLAYSSALTTVSTGNVTGTVSVYNGSKLTLGADMLLSGQFNLYSTGSTLDMGGDKLSASSIYLGWSGGVPTLANRGPLLASNLYVANQPFSLSPSDSAANLYLSNVGLGSLGGHSVSTLSLSNTSALTTTFDRERYGERQHLFRQQIDPGRGHDAQRQLRPGGQRLDAGHGRPQAQRQLHLPGVERRRGGERGERRPLERNKLPLRLRHGNQPAGFERRQSLCGVRQHAQPGGFERRQSLCRVRQHAQPTDFRHRLLAYACLQFGVDHGFHGERHGDCLGL